MLKINGKKYYLWLAVGADGNVLDIVTQQHWDKGAALNFRKLLMTSTQVAA